MSTPVEACNGWKIYFHPLFAEQRDELRNTARKLKQQAPEEYSSHPDVKLYAAVMDGIRQKIPQNPFASHFSLQGRLRKYGRMKKMGLPERYRLFFKAFREEKIIFILWLGYPRKQGDKNDCYKVFLKKVSNGTFPESLDELTAGTDDE